MSKLIRSIVKISLKIWKYGRQFEHFIDNHLMFVFKLSHVFSGIVHIWAIFCLLIWTAIESRVHLSSLISSRGLVVGPGERVASSNRLLIYVLKLLRFHTVMNSDSEQVIRAQHFSIDRFLSKFWYYHRGSLIRVQWTSFWARAPAQNLVARRGRIEDSYNYSYFFGLFNPLSRVVNFLARLHLRELSLRTRFAQRDRRGVFW